MASKVSKFLKLLINPKRLYYRIVIARNSKRRSDESYLNIYYKYHKGKDLDFDNPKTFLEKVQWMKVRDHNPKYTQLVDKVKAKEYLESLGEGKYVVPLYGVYDSFSDIDFDALPDQFVLKCNHDCGSTIICHDKSKFDKEAAEKKLTEALKNNYYHGFREWAYKDIVPKILCEKYITDEEGSSSLTDYKFFCFDGYADCVMVCIGREFGHPKFYFFDSDWNLKRLNKLGREAPADFTIPKPSRMDEMFELARKLSKGLRFVRLDLYQSGDHVYFGEFTFYPAGGFDLNLLPETDEYFGSLIKID